MYGVTDRIDETLNGEWQERVNYSLDQMLVREKALGSDIIRFYDVWDEQRGGKAFPDANNFCPNELFDPSMTKRLSVADLRAVGPEKYRMLRHSGRTIEGFTGKTLDQFPSRFNTEYVAAEYWRCQFSGQPLYSEIDQVLACSTRHYFRALFPVGSDGKVTHLHLAYRVVPD